MSDENPRTAGSASGRAQVHLGAALAGQVESLELRNRKLGRAGVEAAQQVLVDRYRLATPADGFDLLRGASQRFNIKLHTLADLVVRRPGCGRGAVVSAPPTRCGPRPAGSGGTGGGAQQSWGGPAGRVAPCPAHHRDRHGQRAAR
ncbi:ANTAR domain-containing protein [Streptomyces sp. SAS_275]|uniref:ANTAR domain-containing protein n=1 Tax=Streptomyces sp. SAS_275 TaxID=3412746 RepID=UPI00403D2F5D